MENGRREMYYLINNKKNSLLYSEYRNLEIVESEVLFSGHLGEYKYYDMD